MERSPARPPLLIADAVRVWAGAERFALDAARGLGARGWPVTLLCHPGTPLEHRAREAGLDVHTARTRANGAPWTVLPLAAWIRRRGFGAVLSVYDKDLRTAAWAARMAVPDVAVVHSRECDEPIKDRPWIRWFHTRVADRVLVNSQATRATTLASAPWLSPERVDVVGKGVRLPISVPPVPRDRADAVLGFAGQLVRRKRVDLLLRALAPLATAEGEDWSLRIAGTGPESDALSGLARELGIAARVHFEGFVEDMDAWYRTVDVLVLPSLIEGWGYVLAEAAAHGRAVVAFATSSVPEVVPVAAGAVLVDPERGEEGLAEALDRLIREGPEGWELRGEGLRRHARERLGLDRMLDGVETVLQRAIDDRRR